MTVTLYSQETIDYLRSQITSLQEDLDSKTTEVHSLLSTKHTHADTQLSIISHLLPLIVMDS